jgi:hypothetical protein
MAKDLLAAAGLRIAASGGLFHSLLLPRAAQVLKERSAPPKLTPAMVGIGGWNAPRVVTRGVTFALRLDGLVSRAGAALKLEIPGLSWWAICQKPS